MTTTRDRDRLVRELIEVGRDAAARGLVLASAGNLSVRVADDRFLVSGSGVWFDKLTAGKLRASKSAYQQASK